MGNITNTQRAAFIEQIAPIAQEMAKKYGLKYPSVIIGQACKESTFGTSNKVINNGVYMHNYLGLKFKDYKRVPIASGAFNESTYEEYTPGTLTPVTSATWYRFASLRDCVEGYCQFIFNAPNNRYKTYIEAVSVYDACVQIRACGYATGNTYTDSLYNDYILKYNLTKYDSLERLTMNSPLVDYTKISPNREKRKYNIDTIIIHCVVGQVTVESLGNIFAQTSKNASSNYGIGRDGKIGMYVEEKDRAWTTGGIYTVNGWTGSMYDHRSVTIEVASDTVAPYAITEAAMKSLIRLVADIAKRNGIKELKFKGDKNLVGDASQQNIVCHRWFAAKSCPGDYIYNRLPQICSDANQLLGINPISKDAIIYHTVVKGETLNKIGQKYGVLAQSIAYWNGIEDINKIKTGQVLKILVNGTMPTTYTVVKGDSMSKIASACGITLAKLKELNPEVKAPLYIIRVGQVLRIK